MTTDPTQDISGLHWIRRELNESLRQARLVLEEFAEENRGELNDAVDALHQVQGALSVAKVYGGAMLADEMERLAIALGRGQVKDRQAAAEVLMLGIAQLPAYLERIENGEPDIPLVLLPLLNDMREAREAPEVSEAALFAPKLNVQIAAEPVVPGSGNPELSALVWAERVAYHRGLLHWVRDIDIEQGLKELRSVVDRISSAAGTRRLRRLMDAAEALLVALSEGSVDRSPAVRQLFSRLDRVLKSVIDVGEERTMMDFPLDLLKNLLYFVARSDSADPVVQAVRHAADLANSFPEISADELRSLRLGGPGRELFEVVAGELEEDLTQIKDRLDLYMRADRTDLARVAGLVEPLRRMGDTLAMVGRGDLRTRLIPHRDAVQAAVAREQAPDEGDLTELAADLLVVESALMGLSETAESPTTAVGGVQTPDLSGAEYRQHVQSAIDLASVELARIKETLGVYLAAPEQPGVLAELPGSLHSVGGALALVNQPRLSRLVDGLRSFIESILATQRGAPDSDEAEMLADLFSGIEYHLEYLFQASPDRAKALEVAERAVSGLLGVELAAEQAVPKSLETPQSDWREVAAAAEEPPGELGQETSEVDRESAPAADREEEPAVDQGEESPAELDEELARDRFAEPETGREEEPAIDQAQEPETGQQEEPAIDQVEATETEQPGESDIDSEILGIFIEEAREELENIEIQYPLWRHDRSQQEALTLLRRSFHTLKGSGRLVGATEIGEFAWSIENLLNRVIEGTIEADDAVMALLDDTLELLPQLIENREHGGPPSPLVQPLQERASGLARGEPEMPEGAGVEVTVPEPTEASGEVDEEPPAEPEATLPEEPAEPDAPPEEAGAASEENREPETEPAAAAGQEQAEVEWSDAEMDSDESILVPPSETPPPIEMDPTLADIFTREAREHLGATMAFVERCRGRAEGCTFDEDLRRALHTLRGSAHMAGVEAVAELAGTLEKWTELSAKLSHRADHADIELLERGHHTLETLIGLINQAGANEPTWDVLVQEVERRIGLLEQEAQRAAGEKAEPQAEPYDEDLAGIFAEEARELVDGLESTYVEWRERPDDLLPVAQMQRSLHTIKGGARMASLGTIGDLAHATESLFESIADRRVATTPVIQDLARRTLDTLAGLVEALEQGAPLNAYPNLVVQLEAAARGEEPSAFPLEEEAGASTETQTPDAGLEASQTEPGSESLEGEPQRQPEEEAGEPTLLSDSQLLTDSELLVESDLMISSTLVPADGDLESSLDEDSRIIRFPARGRQAETEEEAPRRPPPPQDEEAPSAPTERVRVPASLLDQMVNNAGEISIYRARLEQQNKTLGYNLEELSQTIGRLREQLRKLENETEAQILSRHEREHDGEFPEGFDPLEMDRYSTIQQLSRALSETTEDLGNIGNTMGELGRDTDTLLQQQARIANDLQDGLLRTRMVPVGSRAPRLQRVVRQTAQTLGKRAELTIGGAQGEMDRAILERMMGPLEHLLRNAVAHGVEPPAERESAGKPALGEITLNVGREGPDVVLAVSDDGRGLDREAIRRRAVEKGLMDSDAAIDGEDLDAFILEAGLSTTDEVSQVSGRGVGMDVVVNEIKQLGGSLEIQSEPGQGTAFTIRLPFTLAISEALMVGVGDDIYAVPHGSIDGIARMERSELEACYYGGKDSFSYRERDYKVRYLGSMLGMGAPQLPENERWSPVLLLHSGEHRIAIQVDRLLGNRQIVVKSVGTQLSSIRWFNGGTILADGSIALILDTGSLMRMGSAQQPMPETVSGEPAPQGIRIMVVDDSITVRKVTSRLLERHNMEVVTARDGVDAVALLQEERPDVMLLDIEMPRMDGFELARHMRSTEELKDIPIIMITSRTGDKHRLHAVELGVRRYLGKPYQEAELLENIYGVLGENRS